MQGTLERHHTANSARRTPVTDKQLAACVQEIDAETGKPVYRISVDGTHYVVRAERRGSRTVITCTCSPEPRGK